MKTIPFKKLKDEWMKDATFRAEYERLKPEFARTFDEARGDAKNAEFISALRLRNSA